MYGTRGHLLSFSVCYVYGKLFKVDTQLAAGVLLIVRRQTVCCAAMLNHGNKESKGQDEQGWSYWTVSSLIS